MKKKYIENDLEKKFKDKHEYFSPRIVYVGVLIDTILRFTKFTCFFYLIFQIVLKQSLYDFFFL